MKRLILFAVGLAALAAGGFLYVRARGGDGGPRYETAEVARGRIANQVTATGTLSPVVTEPRTKLDRSVALAAQELVARADTETSIAEELAVMAVHTSVAESDVGSLAEGMPVEFTVDASRPRPTRRATSRSTRRRRERLAHGRPPAPVVWSAYACG